MLTKNTAASTGPCGSRQSVSAPNTIARATPAAFAPTATQRMGARGCATGEQRERADQHDHYATAGEPERIEREAAERRRRQRDVHNANRDGEPPRHCCDATRHAAHPVAGRESAAALARRLHWRTWDIAVRAEHAAVTCLWAQQRVAARALVEELAGMRRHFEGLGEPALGTGERRSCLHGGAGCLPRAHFGTTVAVYLSVATAAIIRAAVTLDGS